MHHFFLSNHYLEVEDCNISQIGHKFDCEGKTNVLLVLPPPSSGRKQRIEEDSKII